MIPAWKRFTAAVHAGLPTPVRDRAVALVAGAEPGTDVLDRAVTELLTDRMISDATWVELPLTDPQKLTLCLLVGDEATAAMVRDSGFIVESGVVVESGDSGLGVEDR